jgi:hypothetical protein
MYSIALCPITIVPVFWRAQGEPYSSAAARSLVGPRYSKNRFQPLLLGQLSLRLCTSRVNLGLRCVDEASSRILHLLARLVIMYYWLRCREVPGSRVRMSATCECWTTKVAAGTRRRVGEIQLRRARRLVRLEMGRTAYMKRTEYYSTRIRVERGG